MADSIRDLIRIVTTNSIRGSIRTQTADSQVPSVHPLSARKKPSPSGTNFFPSPSFPANNPLPFPRCAEADNEWDGQLGQGRQEATFSLPSFSPSHTIPRPQKILSRGSGVAL